MISFERRVEGLRIDALDVELGARESQEIGKSGSSIYKCVLHHSMDCYERHRNGIILIPH